MDDDTQRASEKLLESLRRLADDELVARVKGLAARQRRATALLVAHLAELDTRDLHLRAGYPSLFIYCREVLALSEHEAYNRMEAARTARRFPLVLDLLAEGAVNLTTVRLLGPHLTAYDHARVLESARGKRKSEVEEIVARLAPRPDVPASVRKLSVRTAAAASCSGSWSSAPASGSSATLLPAAPEEAWPGAAESAPPPTGCPRGLAEDVQAAAAPRLRTHEASAGSRPQALHEASAAPRPQARHEASGEVRPLSPDRYRYQLTIGGATLEKLRLAPDMLRHALPSGDDEAILDRALALLLDDLAREKLGSQESARTSRSAPPPAPVRGGRRGHGREHRVEVAATIDTRRLFFLRPEDRGFVPKKRRRSDAGERAHEVDQQGHTIDRRGHAIHCDIADGVADG
jgi:hypothetical protein